jgi:DNA-binding CsgD family transcriptional regulator
MDAGLEVERGRPDVAPLLVLCDAGGNIRALNAEFARVSGHDPVTLVGRPFSDLLEGAGLRLEPGISTVRVPSAAGDALDFEVAVNPLLGESTGAIAFALLLRPCSIDLTPPESADKPLSDRERQILDFVAEGYRVATIARALFISPSTVRNHLSAIFRKVGVTNQAELLEYLKRTTTRGVNQRR